MALSSKFEKANGTRRSLLSRVKNPDDHESWKVFFDTYRKLVYSAAAKAGLTHDECEEVVQKTFLALLKAMPNFKYDPAVGSFKSWLIHTTQFKIRDQFRLRPKQPPKTNRTRTGSRTATIERIPDPAAVDVGEVFEEEWRERLLDLALERLKNQVPASQYQIFDLYVVKKWPVSKIASTLGIGSGRIYLAKHRLANLLKREVKALKAEFA